MKIIGITGSSGSGKSTISKIVADELNGKLIVADDVVKRMQQPGTNYFIDIISLVGEEYLDDKGNLNRKKLATLIFRDNEKREGLNNLTNKYVVEEIKKEVKNSSCDYVIIDVPLLLESDLDKLCNLIIGVIAKKSIKIKRICKRDNIEEDVANQRLNIQQTDEYYIDKSDFVIRNNENENLEEKVEDLLNKIKERGMTSES